MPASRPKFNFKTGRTYNEPAYMEYKRHFALSLRAAFMDRLPAFPPVGSAQRSQYLAGNRYSLIVHVYRSVNRGDIDNFIKTVQDAMQDAGLLADDSQIDKVIGKKFIDKTDPRIEFTLEHIELCQQELLNLEEKAG